MATAALAAGAVGVPSAQAATTLEVPAAAATIPEVVMSCSAGQVDINHASASELATQLQVDLPVAGRVVSMRPYLKPKDLLVVPGIGGTVLTRILGSGVACATLTQVPPPAIKPCTTKQPDAQSSTAADIAKRVGISLSAAQRIVAARPFATLAHVTPERVPGVGKGVLDQFVSKTCLTPAPVRTATASWRWAYHTLDTTVSRDLFSLKIPKGVLDGPGAWASVTPTTSTGTALAGVSADFHINGAWADGTQTVEVTTPTDPDLPYLQDIGVEPVMIHAPTGGRPEVYFGEHLSVSTDGRSQTVAAVGLSVFSGSSLASSILAPLRIISAPTATDRGALLAAVRKFNGTAADPPECSPNLTSNQRVSTEGDILDAINILGLDKFAYHCVTYGESVASQARWKFANNSGVAVHVVTALGKGVVVDIPATGDTITDLMYALWNDTAGDPADTHRTRVDVPPGAEVWIDLDAGNLAQPVSFDPSEPSTLVAFVLRELDSLIPYDLAKDAYTELKQCLVDPAVSPENYDSVTFIKGCVLTVTNIVLGDPQSSDPKLLKNAKVLAKAASSVIFLLDAGVSVADLFGNLPARHDASITFRNPPPVAPPLPGPNPGSGTTGPDGTIVDGGPRDGIIWRRAGGLDGTTRGQPYVIFNQIGYSSADPTRQACLARHYVTRDFVPWDEPLIWLQDWAQEALCPEGVGIDLPADATNWIVRQPSGAAWFVNSSSQLENITTGGGYINCAQKYLVVDEAPTWLVTRFGNPDTAPPASCMTG